MNCVSIKEVQMKRVVLFITILILLVGLSSCRSLSETVLIACDEPLAPEMDIGRTGIGFELFSTGSLTNDPDYVISGSTSLLANNGVQDSRLHLFLRTRVQLIRFKPGGTYTVKFSYRVLRAPTDDSSGFEMSVYSPEGSSKERWVPAYPFTGNVGETELASYSFELYDFSDYKLEWNVIGSGSVVIDDVMILDHENSIILAENFEYDSPYKTAQSFLPNARKGQPYRYTPAIRGSEQPPVKIEAATSLPAGLHISGKGTLEGIPEEEGSFTIFLACTDDSGEVSYVPYRLDVVPANISSAAPIVGKEIVGTNTVAYSYDSYLPAFSNPLKGMRPGIEPAMNHPWASLARQYFGWNSLERNACDTVERIKHVTDYMVGDLSAYNIKIIPRVYLLYTPEPSCWPEDLETGDFHSKEFKNRMLLLIAKLGEAWNDDPRIAYVEMGIIGDCGEHHDPGFGNLGFVEPNPVLFAREFAEAFKNAFPDKLLMRRYPRDFVGYPFGIHWDVFGNFGSDYWANDSTLMAEELKKPEHVDAWKTFVRGGEIDPLFLGYSGWSDSNFFALVKEHGDRLVSIIKDIHWNHLAVLDRFNYQDKELWEKASTIQNALGYTFMVEQSDLPAQIWQGNLSLSIKIVNKGATPLYYDWPLQVALLDPDTRRPVWSAIWPGIDIRTWLPEDTQSLEHTFRTYDIPDGQYIVAITILDPAGMVPAVRFANANYFSGGYTPLGIVGVGEKPLRFELTGFDDLASDCSLYYLPKSN
ncbi:MAG: DUF4832 domain-containing protein [Sphaerochaetaceae bacterium]